MNGNRRTEYEIARILMAAVDGEATLDELAYVNRLLAEDRSLAAVVVDVMNQQSWLAWYSTKARDGGPLRADLLEQIIATATETPTLSSTIAEDVPMEGAGALSLATPGDSWPYASRSQHIWRCLASPAWAAAAVLAFIALGWSLGFGYAQWDSGDGLGDDGAPPIVLNPPSSEAGQSRYVARLVQGTACLWSSNGESPFSGEHDLRMGESLNLVEGLAEVELAWTEGQAALQIEGPAGLVLTAERGASLSHGKLTADIRTSQSLFSLTTPNGLIEVSANAALGVSIAGGDVELHVFRGQAEVLLPWTVETEGVRRMAVSAGQSLRVAADADGRMSLVDGVSSPGAFASQLSMGSDNLHIGKEYVRAVLAARPILYWRFEDSDSKRVTNAAGDRYHGKVVGAAQWLKHRDNQYLDLGSAMSDEAFSTYLITEEPIRESFDEGYAVEAWIKPSHYHWCTLTALICPPPQPGWRSPHAFLLELGGPRAAETSIEHPGKIRYLHRSPPSTEVEAGTSLFTDEPYELRKWQHMVAVKDGSRMRLYVNGKLSASAEDPTPLASNWKLVVGQLDEEQNYRRFVGQMDELAIYPRPLSEEEIKRHYKLSRESPPLRAKPAPPDRTADAAERAKRPTGAAI